MKLCFLCNDVFTLRKILKKYIFRYINGPHWNFVINCFKVQYNTLANFDPLCMS